MARFFWRTRSCFMTLFICMLGFVRSHIFYIKNQRERIRTRQCRHSLYHTLTTVVCICFCAFEQLEEIWCSKSAFSLSSLCNLAFSYCNVTINGLNELFAYDDCMKCNVKQNFVIGSLGMELDSNSPLSCVYCRVTLSLNTKLLLCPFGVLPYSERTLH